MIESSQAIASSVFGFIAGVGLMSWIFIWLDKIGKIKVIRKQIKGGQK